MLAQRLKNLRREAGETQASLADELFISQRTIASWEAGTRTPSFEMLMKLARRYHVSVSYLLGETDCPLLVDILLEKIQDGESLRCVDPYCRTDKLVPEEKELRKLVEEIVKEQLENLQIVPKR